MSFGADDFGDSADLLKAIGLVKDGGDLEGDWVKNPDTYMKDILADDDQRAALIRFVEQVRGGSSDDGDPDRHWVELFSESIPNFGDLNFYIVIDDTPTDEVRLFLGVKLEAGDPTICEASVLFPLFRTAKKDKPVPTPGLVGEIGGDIELAIKLILSTSRPAAGEAGIGGLGFTAKIPTASPDGLSLDLSISDLQLPGETASRDIALSLTDPDALKDVALELVFALIQAQTGGAADQITALIELLGLSGSPNIPNFPISQLAEDGVEALSDWLAQVLGSDTARGEWLDALADLIGSSATATPEGISISLGGAAISIGLRVQPGPTGLPIVTLSLGITISNANTQLDFKADLVTLDLATASANALTDLRATLKLDTNIDTTAVKIDAIFLGLAMAADHKPVFVLEMRDVRVQTTDFTVLDLTNPDAVADAGTQVITDALDDILGDLGPAGIALGWDRPSGTSYPLVDRMAFFADPLGRLHGHWQNVFDNHAGDVDEVLKEIAELVTGNSVTITGSGTDASPWLIPLETTSQFALALWKNDHGRLVIGILARFKLDDLGERCTVIESHVRVAITSIDLATGNTEFLSEIKVGALGRARGGAQLQLESSGLRLEVDHLGLAGRWTPSTGFTMGLDAPNPLLFLNNIPLPLDIPNFSGGFDDFFASLTRAQWDSIERISGLLAVQLDFGWLRDLIDALHWLPEAPILGAPSTFRLSLQGLFEDAGLELRSWLIRLIRGNGGLINSKGLKAVFKPLARLLSGNTLDEFNVEGSGTISDPYRVHFGAATSSPALALWLEPDIAIPPPDFQASNLLRNWRPGMQGLSAGSLASAIFSEFPDLDGLLPGGLTEADVTAHLAEIVAQLRGTDGLCRPPATMITDVTIHFVENETSADILERHEAGKFIGTAPPNRLVVISTVDESAAAPSIGTMAAQVLDLREAGRDALSFPQLPGQNGFYQILLAPRKAAKLASGDPDGVVGQAARLKHALALLADQAGTSVMADAASSHAAWIALDEMGEGINDLVLVGAPLTTLQQPPSINFDVADMLSRLAELLPPFSDIEPDDDILAMARSLLAPRTSIDAISTQDLGLPTGWSNTKRATLEVHAVYGVITEVMVSQALTAIIAAGLSLHSQARALRRSVQRVTGAGLGLYLPVMPSAGAGTLSLKGHVLTEVIGTDIDTSGALPDANLRDAKRVLGHLELSRNEGWLIGGPGASPRLPLELRALELHGQFAYGGATAQPDCLKLVLFGVRIHLSLIHI